MVSRILRDDESAHWGWRYERDVPADGTDEIEIDNDAPCYSLCLEGCGCVKELELWDMSQRQKGGNVRGLNGYMETSGRYM